MAKNAINESSNRCDTFLAWIFALFAFIALIFEPMYYFPCHWRLDEGLCKFPENDGIFLMLWRLYGGWDALFFVVPRWLQLMCTVEVVVFGPCYALCSFYLFRAKRPWWFQPFVCAFCGALIYSTVIYFGYEFIFPDSSTDLLLVFVVNVPWTITPCILLYRTVSKLKPTYAHRARDK